MVFKVTPDGELQDATPDLNTETAQQRAKERVAQEEQQSLTTFDALLRLFDPTPNFSVLKGAGGSAAELAGGVQDLVKSLEERITGEEHTLIPSSDVWLDPVRDEVSGSFRENPVGTFAGTMVGEGLKELGGLKLLNKLVKGMKVKDKSGLVKKISDKSSTLTKEAVKGATVSGSIGALDAVDEGESRGYNALVGIATGGVSPYAASVMTGKRAADAVPLTKGEKELVDSDMEVTPEMFGIDPVSPSKGVTTDIADGAHQAIVRQPNAVGTFGAALRPIVAKIKGVPVDDEAALVRDVLSNKSLLNIQHDIAKQVVPDGNIAPNMKATDISNAAYDQFKRGYNNVFDGSPDVSSDELKHLTRRNGNLDVLADLAENSNNEWAKQVPEILKRFGLQVAAPKAPTPKGVAGRRQLRLPKTGEERYKPMTREEADKLLRDLSTIDNPEAIDAINGVRRELASKLTDPNAVKNLRALNKKWPDFLTWEQAAKAPNSTQTGIVSMDDLAKSADFIARGLGKEVPLQSALEKFSSVKTPTPRAGNINTLGSKTNAKTMKKVQELNEKMLKGKKLTPEEIKFLQGAALTFRTSTSTSDTVGARNF